MSARKKKPRASSGIKGVLLAIGIFCGIATITEPDTWLFGLVLLLVCAYHIIPKETRKNFLSGFRNRGVRRYEAIIGPYRETPISLIAEAFPKPENDVVEELQDLINHGYFAGCYFDFERRMFIVPANPNKRDQKVTTEDIYEGVEKVTCPYCGQKVPGTVKFCLYCGQSLENIRKIVDLRSECACEISDAMRVIPASEVRSAVISIGERIDQIFRKLLDEPALIDDSGKFMDYYLPKTMKAIENYKELVSLSSPDKNELEVKAQIEDTLQVVEPAFERIYKKLAMDGIFDLSADVSLLKNLIEVDGLADPAFDL